MVSLRCKMVVREELRKIGIVAVVMDLGMVEILEEITKAQHDALKVNLAKFGLQLLDDKHSVLIEKIKTAIIEMIHCQGEMPAVNYADYLSEKLGYDYAYLSNIFTEVKGTTILQFIIIQKIEKVKEFILYDELTLAEIADKMHYSSVGQLTREFEKITGLSPSFFKTLKQKRKQNVAKAGYM
jgi:AraC-like DNA-binding protein